MPIYPGAPWVPKFDGPEGNLKYLEWKEQMQGLLDANNLTEPQKVKILIGALSGLPKRQINVLADDERDRVAKVFTVLDELYVKEVPVSVLRSLFFGCVQKPGQSVQAYALHLRELYRKLERQDQEGAPTDTHLRDQFMLGLEDGALLRALKREVRLDPDITFSALKEEALRLEEDTHSSRWPETTCAAVREPNHSRSHSQNDSWKQELKQEIVAELKDQMKDFARELIRELRPASPAYMPVRRNSAPEPRSERRYPQPHPGNRWDEGGRPICRNCNQTGHIARFCRAPPVNQPALN